MVVAILPAWAQPVHLPVASPTAAMPSSMAKLEMEEDKGNPPVALLIFEEKPLIHPVQLLVDVCMVTLCLHVTIQFTATSSTMTRLGTEEDNKNPNIDFLDFERLGA